MRAIRMSGSMSGVWKRSQVRTSKAPPDERGGKQICSGYRYRATPRLHQKAGRVSCWATLSDELREVGDGWVAGDDEPGAEVVPERDAELGAGLGEAEEGIAAVAAGIAARAAADLAFGHLAADVGFRAVC